MSPYKHRLNTFQHRSPTTIHLHSVSTYLKIFSLYYRPHVSAVVLGKYFKYCRIDKFRSFDAQNKINVIQGKWNQDFSKAVSQGFVESGNVSMVIRYVIVTCIDKISWSSNFTQIIIGWTGLFIFQQVVSCSIIVLLKFS